MHNTLFASENDPKFLLGTPLNYNTLVIYAILSNFLILPL